MGGAADKGRILSEHPRGCVRLARLPRRAAALALRRGQLHIECTALGLDTDALPRPKKRHRPGPGGLRRHLSNPPAVTAAGEPPVGNEGDLVAEAPADERGRGAEHLAHTRAALWALVADHDYVPG